MRRANYPRRGHAHRYLALFLSSMLFVAGAGPAMPEPPPPPLDPLPPIMENFGFGRFNSTPDEIEQGLQSQISSESQLRLWRALISLVQSNKGYHTAAEVERALGVTLTMTGKPRDATDTGRWDADLPDAHVQLFESELKSKIFGQQSLMIVRWDNLLSRPDCVSPFRAAAEIEQLGGVGYFQRADYRRYHLANGGADVGIGSRNLPFSDTTCINELLLTGSVEAKPLPH